jgi:Rad3-related DNA helicase
MPAKFERWRPAQEEALQFLLRSTKRAKAPSMPTGSGKTAVYVGHSLITREPTAFVTENIGLMDQLLEDFRDCGMVSLMGKRRYTCDLKPEYTCEDGHAARCPKKGTIGCPLSHAEMAAAVSPLVVTNYDKWTSSRKFGQGMAHFTKVVFDEGHLAPEALARAMQVVLSHHEIEEVLGVDFPKQREEMVDWKYWASWVRAEAEEQMIAAKALITGPDPKPTYVRKYMHLRNLCKRLATIATCQPQNWVCDELEKGFQFDPVKVARYSESTLLLRVPNIIVISATLRPKTLYMLGLGRESFDFLELGSDFDPKDCPIYYIPTMRVDSRAEDLSPLWIKLEQIASARQDRKGIVHTISYARRDAILGRSRFAPSMIVNPKGEASTETVMAYKAAGPGAILVSPSVGAGFDFPGRDCEWQFVCKIPFPDSRSKIVRARQEDDKEYGPYQAINKLVQIFGRGARFKGDRCENFIGDMHLDWFLPRYGHLAPKSFHGFFKRIEVAPPTASSTVIITLGGQLYDSGHSHQGRARGVHRAGRLPDRGLPAVQRDAVIISWATFGEPGAWSRPSSSPGPRTLRHFNAGLGQVSPVETSPQASTFG